MEEANNKKTPDVNVNGDGRFVSSEEYAIASLKNGIINNLITGDGFQKEDAIVTNRRLYYNRSVGILWVRREEQKVNINDITGTKITDIRPRIFLILAILAAVVGVIGYVTKNVPMEGMLAFLGVALVFLLGYVLGIRKYLRVEYAGGYIHFSVRRYGMDNIRTFQKSIHAAKENREEELYVL